MKINRKYDDFLLYFRFLLFQAKKIPLQTQGEKRMMGIEPTSKAWEAFILPMNYIRTIYIVYPVFWIL